MTACFDRRRVSLYAVENKDLGAVKIGFSKSPRARLTSLDGASPSPLGPLRVRGGSRWDERAAHLIFRKNHIRGEWYAASAELMRVIRANFRVLEPRRPRDTQHPFRGGRLPTWIADHAKRTDDLQMQPSIELGDVTIT